MNIDFLTIVNYFITSLIASISGWTINYIKKQLEKSKKDTDSVKLGIQALLRAKMIDDYNKWNDKGYAPIYARQNFENCYTQYKNLGADGVINDLYQKFFSLSVEETTEKRDFENK